MNRHRISRCLRGGLLGSTVLWALAGPAGAQGLAPLEREFANGATLRFYGQINKGILGYDDGIDTETYYVIDNDNSGTRFGFEYTQSFGDWTFGNVNEFRYAPYSTANINIIDDSPSSEDYEWSNDNIRRIDFSLEHDRFGKVSLGQGSMATDGVAEYDLSGTDVIAYSGIGDSASAQIIRFSDPTLFFADNPQIGEAFQNYDGGRLARVRYDTPSFSGFSVAFAYGQDLLSGDDDERDINQYDVSLNYEGAFETFEVAAGIGYYADDEDAEIWAGSASALHTPTGINGTFAAGAQDFDGDNGTYWYGKLGLLRRFLAWGDSAAAVDYYSGDDIFLTGDVRLFDSGGEPVFDEEGNPVIGDITSSESESWGLSVVQDIDAWNTELWLTWRSYDYADDFASYEDGQANFGGARFTF
jgi:hypothetical protein